MSDYDYDHGEPDEFEIVWKTGHVDRLKAHQVTWPDSAAAIFGGLFGSRPAGAPRILFHGQIDGRWRLLLSAPEDDIATVRNLTQVGDQA